MKATLFAVAAALFASASAPAAAHQNSRAYVDVDVDGRAVVVKIDASLAAIAPLLRAGPGVRPTAAVYRKSAAKVLDRVRRYLALTNARAKACDRGRSTLTTTEAKVTMSFAYRCPPGALQLTYDLLFDDDPQHRAFVSLRVTGGDIDRLALFSNTKRTLEFAPVPSLWEEIGSFFRLGLHHIFGGYDHILFVLALLLIAPLKGGDDGRRSLRPGVIYLLKVVTAFTVAHSITIALGALELVTLPSRPVETAIALSIAYVAIENMFVIDPRHRWWLVFVFGLMHGFGFAQVLGETGLPAGMLAASLLSFNLGVEAGQIAIVALFYPIIHRLAGDAPGALTSLWLAALLGAVLALLGLSGVALSFRPVVCFVLLAAAIVGVKRVGYRRAVVQGGSALIAAFGLLWVIQRAFDVTLFGGLLG